jgi:hypothetical protein
LTRRAKGRKAAASDLGIAKRHKCGQWPNNRAKNSHQPTRRQERKIHGFKSVRVSRNFRTIALSLTLLALPVVPAGANNPAAATKIHWSSTLSAEATKSAWSTIDIERQNDRTTIKIKKDVSVKVMFIEAYLYEHSCNEAWKNGQLVAFKSRTNDNGTKHSIDVTAAPNKLSMDADGKHSDLPKTVAPASLWARTRSINSTLSIPIPASAYR